MDERPEVAVLDDIRATTLAVGGVKAIDSARVHRRGSTFTIDMEIAVDSKLTVEQGHEVAAEVRDRLMRETAHVQDVMVHVNPYKPRQTPDFIQKGD